MYFYMSPRSSVQCRGRVQYCQDVCVDRRSCPMIIGHVLKSGIMPCDHGTWPLIRLVLIIAGHDMCSQDMCKEQGIWVWKGTDAMFGRRHNEIWSIHEPSNIKLSYDYSHSGSVRICTTRLAGSIVYSHCIIVSQLSRNEASIAIWTRSDV